MIIVLEGLPGSGKTTIASLLKSKYCFGLVLQIIVDVEKIKSQPNFKNPYFINDEEKCLQMETLAKRHQHVVVDRNYISTLAFNYALGKDPKHHSTFSIAKEWYVNSFGQKLIPPSQYIYFKTPIKYCFSRKGRKPNLKNVWANSYYLKRMKHFYENTFPLMETNIPKIVVSSELPIETMLNLIVSQCLK